MKKKEEEIDYGADICKLFEHIEEEKVKDTEENRKNHQNLKLKKLKERRERN